MTTDLLGAIAPPDRGSRPVEGRDRLTPRAVPVVPSQSLGTAAATERVWRRAEPPSYDALQAALARLRTLEPEEHEFVAREPLRRTRWGRLAPHRRRDEDRKAAPVPGIKALEVRTGGTPGQPERVHSYRVTGHVLASCAPTWVDDGGARRSAVRTVLRLVDGRFLHLERREEDQPVLLDLLLTAGQLLRPETGVEPALLWDFVEQQHGAVPAQPDPRSTGSPPAWGPVRGGYRFT